MSRKKEVFDYSRSGRDQDLIRKPLQERSRQKVDQIMDALEALLAEKPFDRITMVELAQKSGAGTSSIYARFGDKDALILGVHARLRDQVLQCLNDLTDPDRWEGRSIEEIVPHVISATVRFYRKHEFLIRASLFVDDVIVRERQASVLRNAAEKFSVLFKRADPTISPSIDSAVDASTRIVTSVIYSTFMFGSVPLVRKAVSDRELARQLTCAVIALINDAAPIRTSKSASKK